MLRGLAGGLGSIALVDILARELGAATSSAPQAGGQPLPTPHFPPRAKRVIFLFMHGGPSHVDTFDYKPMLIKHDGRELPFAKPRVQFAQTGNLLKSPWRFRQYGECGAWVSDLFTQTAAHVDDMTFV
jgi:hypothetical protein